MKKPFALFFAAYFLLGGFLPRMDFSQLLYLADAVEHFHCHQLEMESEGEDFSWIDYLFLHFINPDTHQHQDHHEHDQLPLHQFAQGLQFVAAVQYTLGDHTFSTERSAILPEVLDFYQSDFTGAIDHPPSC